MQIVIDISEEEYEWVKRANRQTTPLDRWCVKAIANGTPLPEHHGRLIDADKLLYEDIESIDGNTYMCVNAYDVEHAPTIIEGE